MFGNSYKNKTQFKQTTLKNKARVKRAPFKNSVQDFLFIKMN